MSSFPFNLALFFDRLCRGTPACLYGFGLSVAARKALLLPEWAGAGALAAGWAALWALWALGLAAGIALRKPFSREYADAWLDWKNRAGGAVLAHADPAPPRVRPGITLRPFAKSVAPPLAFALAALALPAMRGREHRAAEAIRNRVDAAEELLAARGEMLAPPDRERFARQLEAMRDVAEENPEAAAEALASFERRVAEAEAEERRSGGAAEAAAGGLDAARAGQAGGADGGGGGREAAPEALLSAWREAEGGGSEESAGEGVSASASRAARGGGGAEGNAAAVLERLLSAGDARGAAVPEAGGAAGEGGAADAAEGAGGVGKGGGDSPPLVSGPPPGGGAAGRLHPLPPGRGDGGGVTLFRERVSPGGAMAREEFRPPGRSAVDAPRDVRAGDAAQAPGPARARAVERYFQALGADRGR